METGSHRLEDFQREIVEEVFSPRRETLVLIPRGCGRSTLLAAVALWSLLRGRSFTPSGESGTHPGARMPLAEVESFVRDLAGHFCVLAVVHGPHYLWHAWQRLEDEGVPMSSDSTAAWPRQENLARDRRP